MRSAAESPRKARGIMRAADRRALSPPVANTTRKPEPCVIPAPYVPSVSQDLECCLLGVRDCLTKMRQTEVTDRAIRAIDRTLKLL